MYNSQKAMLAGILLGSLILLAGINFASNGTLFLALRSMGDVPNTAIHSSSQSNKKHQEGNLPSQEGLEPLGSCFSLSKFPPGVRQWCSLIERSAARNGIEPTILAAVILLESAGNPQAISTSGAIGLMQVMPRDGPASGFQCINGPCFADRPSSQDLLDPAYNVEFGAQMLGDLYHRYGNIREALKTYGPIDVGYRYADIVLQTNTDLR